MKAGYNWLKKYIDTDEGPEDLAKAFTMAGSEVESIEDAAGDKVLSFEITSNRPDCLNIIGLARELSAVYDKDLKVPGAEIGGSPGKGPGVECVIEAGGLCPRYTARVITGVKVKPASDSVKKPIEALGMRPVNNIVDVTNFCLMETGQPMHAFDLDKIAGGRIIVREAGKGEKITTIDGVERKLEPGMLVIADADRPVAIAGVMGGRDTEVTASTRNILLESAYFDPLSVRRTARKLGLSTDSSYRFERGVDKAMVVPASDRAALMIADEAGGTICELHDAGEALPERPQITFDIARAAEILGVPLERNDVERILTRLGLKVKGEDGTALTVQVPSFREDLRRAIDLVEEIARIHGYHNIPARVSKLVPQIERKTRARQVTDKVRQLMWGAGLREIMTYNMAGEEAVERLRGISPGPVKLKNPLSEELQYLVPQLVHGMLKTISWNINRQNRDLAFFEIGKTYAEKDGQKGFLETQALCIGLTGAARKSWKEGNREADIFDLKGCVDLVMGRLGLEAIFLPGELEEFSACAELAIRGKEGMIGFAGEVKKPVLRGYDIEQPVFICQVDLSAVQDAAVLENRYAPIPKFPFSTRDVSVLCDDSVAAGRLYEAMVSSGEETVREIELTDAYRGEKIPDGKVSYTYSIKYGSAARTLQDQEIEDAHARIKALLEKKFKVSFR